MTKFAPRKGMTDKEINSTVEAILQEATIEEKVAMMSGKGFFESMQRTGRRWGGEPYRAGGGCERPRTPC